MSGSVKHTFILNYASYVPNARLLDLKFFLPKNMCYMNQLGAARTEV